MTNSSNNNALENTTPADFFKWSVLGNGTVSIDGYTGNDEKVVIPSEIDGKTVTDIGMNAFKLCSALTSINIPYSVKTIGKFAFFGCQSLKEITIPDGVTEIGVCTFAVCTSLTSINLPDSAMEIGERAFDNCTSLPSIKLPDGVTTIGDGAFVHCRSLTSIKIPESVTEIGVDAFLNCKSLATITLPDSVDIGEDAFKGTPLEYKFRTTQILTTTDAEKTTCPKCLREIPENSIFCAFCGEKVAASCSACGAELVEGAEFCHICGTRIEESAAPAASADKFEWSVLGDGTVSIVEHIASDRKVVIPSIINGRRVSAIASDSFAGEPLTSVTIPESVEKIEGWAFSFCKSLSSVNIRDGVKEIGECAFYHCKSLTSISIPESVTKIGQAAFKGCKSLASVNLPDNVKIDKNAFKGTPLEDKFK